MSAPITWITCEVCSVPGLGLWQYQGSACPRCTVHGIIRAAIDDAIADVTRDLDLDNPYQAQRARRRVEDRLRKLARATLHTALTVERYMRPVALVPTDASAPRSAS